MKYGIFYGCAIPSRLPFVEKSTAFLLEKLGIEAAPLQDATCCMDPIVLKSLSVDAWVAVAARNLAEAASQGFEGVLALCNGCFCSLNEAARMLEDGEQRDRVNALLKEVGKEYPGGIAVRHLTQVLEQLPPEELDGKVVRPLDGQRVATFHGCHLVRPSAHAQVDDPVRPTILDRLVERLGGEPVEWSERNECCGMGFVPTGERTGAERLAASLQAMTDSGATWIVTPCPSCFLQLETAQKLAKLDPPLPVMHVAEVYARALGLDDDAMGLRYHRVAFPKEEMLV